MPLTLTLLAPLKVGLVPPPVTAEVTRLSLLEGVMGLDETSLVGLLADDWEPERGLKPTCLSIIFAVIGGGGDDGCDEDGRYRLV